MLFEILILLVVGLTALDWLMVTNLESIAMRYGVSEDALKEHRRDFYFSRRIPIIAAVLAAFMIGLLTSGTYRYASWAASLGLAILWLAKLGIQYAALIRDKSRDYAD